MTIIDRESQHRRPLRIRVHHHTNDSVEATIVLRERTFKVLSCPPLHRMTPTQAADTVANFVIKIHAALQRALDADEARGPTDAS